MLKDEPIAIIGISCKFPDDVNSFEEFWQYLLSGKSPIDSLSKKRKRFAFDPSIKGGALNNVDRFDANFFNISSEEAQEMDPQHRLFLECTYHAINHANIAPKSLSNTNTAVFCGSSSHDYQQLNAKQNLKTGAYSGIGTSSSALSGRVAYFLNLKGPNLVIDTACSSSLAALDLAFNSLKNFESDCAIVGGVNLNLATEPFIGYKQAQMLSPTGQCRSFDDKADGYVRSEACVVVIVKRLKDALLNKDKVWAVLKSITINQDGTSKGLRAPNIEAQITLSQTALDKAKLKASEIDYIEAHGTGTIIGDPSEFSAIEAVHAKHHSKEQPLIIGALKSQIGHTLAASGLAGLIKAVAALHYQKIPANLNFEKANKKISLNNIPSIIPTQPIPWPKVENKKRRAQIQAFGFTGTNVCTILEESPTIEFEALSSQSEPCVFVLSAKSQNALEALINSYIQYLKKCTDNLIDICYTAAVCRDHFSIRIAIIANTKNDLLEKILQKKFTTASSISNEDIKIEDNSLSDLAKAYLSGKNIEWHNIFNIKYQHFKKVILPSYQFDKKSFWKHAPLLNTNRSISANDDIAIIGMSCRFPKSDNIEAFYQLLKNGLDGFQTIPKSRWEHKYFYNNQPGVPGHTYVKEMAFIEDVKGFDASFFKINAREAKFMDPQQRIFLECAYLALENANIAPDLLADSLTGVFAGVGNIEYYENKYRNLQAKTENTSYAITGRAAYIMPSRVSSAFNLKGPCKAITAACSSSLIAIHDACRSLNQNECNLAIAGSAHLILSPETSISLSKIEALSPSNRCKTFDKDADGFAKGEGCGVVILKRLKDAVKDKDAILAVIDNTAVNSDGQSEASLVPNGDAQEKLIQQCLANSDLTANNIQYIEAHGTGTKVGDPIEINAIKNTIEKKHTSSEPIYISSVKTNIGHCEPSAGIAGLIKVILSLQSNTIFKHLNFNKINPKIALGKLNIPQKNIIWPRTENTRAAIVNAFGFGGMNAIALIKDPPIQPKFIRKKHNAPLPLSLSAKSLYSLDQLREKYIGYLSNTSSEFCDICYSAAITRNHYQHRILIIASNHAEAIDKLKIAPNPAELTQYPPSELKSISEKYLSGHNIDWQHYFSKTNYPYKKVLIPEYQFDRKPYWLYEAFKTKGFGEMFNYYLGVKERLPSNIIAYFNEFNKNIFQVQHTESQYFPFPFEAYLKIITELYNQYNSSPSFYSIQSFNQSSGFIAYQRKRFQLHTQHNKNDLLTIYSEENDLLEKKLSCNLNYQPSAEHKQAWQLYQNKVTEIFKSQKLPHLIENQSLTHIKNLTQQDLLALAIRIIIQKNNLAETYYYINYFSAATFNNSFKSSEWLYIENTTNDKQYNLYFIDNNKNLTGYFLKVSIVSYSLEDAFLLSYPKNLCYSPSWQEENQFNSHQNITEEKFILISPIAINLAQAKQFTSINSLNELKANIENLHICYLYQEKYFQHFIEHCQQFSKIRPKTLSLISQNAYLINETGKINPQQTMASSFWKTFTLEQSINSCYQFDIAALTNLNLISQLLLKYHTLEPQYAVRDKLYIPRLIESKISKNQISIKEQASYIITGGTGALSKLLINYLISKGAKNIILLSRHKPIGELKKQCKIYQKHGIRIYHYKQDLINQSHFNKTLKKISQKHRVIKGIFHLAGTIKDNIVQNIKLDTAQQVIKTKAASAWCLHKFSLALDLDYFVLFSSTAAYFGSKGQSIYAYANGFLDGLAHLRQSQNLVATTINWGPWDNIGMTAAVNTDYQKLGTYPLKPEAIYVLDKILNQPSSQVICSDFNWQLLSSNKDLKPIFLSCRDYQPQLASESDLLKTNSKTKQNIKEIVYDVVIELFEMEDPQHIEDEDLYDLGMDSLLANELKNKIINQLKKVNLNLNLDGEIFYVDPTINSITHSINQALKKATASTIAKPNSNRSIITQHALGYNQLDFWLSANFDFSSWHMAARYQFHGTLNITFLKQALELTVSNHPAFYLALDPDNLTQHIDLQNSPLEITIDQTPISKSDIDHHFKKQLFKPYQWHNRKNITAKLFKLSNMHYELQLFIPHIIADDYAFITLYEELKYSYQKLLSNQKPIFEAESLNFISYASEKNIQSLENIKQKANFWSDYLKSDHGYQLKKYLLVKDVSKQQTFLEHFLIENTVVKNFSEKCQAQKLNLQYALMAISYLSLQKLSQQKSFFLYYFESPRSLSEWQNIGLFSEIKKIKVTSNKDLNFHSIYQNIESEALNLSVMQNAPIFFKNKIYANCIQRFLNMMIKPYLFNNKLKQLKNACINPYISDKIIQQGAQLFGQQYIIKLKSLLNKLPLINLPLLKPMPLNIYLNIYHSFFLQEKNNPNFADLKCSIPEHLSSLDRNFGNKNLFIYFTKNFQDQCYISINGPLTKQCRQLMAKTIIKALKDFNEQ